MDLKKKISTHWKLPNQSASSRGKQAECNEDRQGKFLIFMTDM